MVLTWTEFGYAPVRMEPLEGMGFLTESGSIRTVQRDSDDRLNNCLGKCQSA
jgi:hypothetical protein